METTYQQSMIKKQKNGRKRTEEVWWQLPVDNGDATSVMETQRQMATAMGMAMVMAMVMATAMAFTMAFASSSASTTAN